MRNDTLGAVSELAASQHGCFTRSQAALLHLTRRQIRDLLENGVVSQPCPGVFVLTAVPETNEQSIMAATLARGGTRASHRDAALLHEIDGFSRLACEVSVERPRNVQIPGVTVHQVKALPPCDLVEVNRIATTSLARTFVDLGSVCTLDAMQRAFDDLVRRNVSLRWLTETATRLHRPGQRGTGVALELLAGFDTRGTVPDTWFERLLLDIIDDPTMPEVVTQFRLQDQTGNDVARFDLAMPEVRLGIEAHSRRFHFGSLAEGRDEDRDHAVSACGWDTMYLGWQATRSPADTLEKVRRTVAARRALLLGRSVA